MYIKNIEMVTLHDCCIDKVHGTEKTIKENKSVGERRVVLSTIVVLPTIAITFGFEVGAPTLASTIIAMTYETVAVATPLCSREFSITKAIVVSIEGHGIWSIIRSNIRSERRNGHRNNHND